MDLGPARAFVFTLNRAVHGLDVTVTLPDEAPIETRGIWLTEELAIAPGADGFCREPRFVLALGRDEVPRIVRGTAVLAIRPGGTELERWRVDGIERIEGEHHRVVLVPDPELES